MRHTDLGPVSVPFLLMEEDMSLHDEIVKARANFLQQLSASMAHSAAGPLSQQPWYYSTPLSAVPGGCSVGVKPDTEPTLRVLDEETAFHALHDVEHLPSIQDRIAALQRKGIVLAQWPSA